MYANCHEFIGFFTKVPKRHAMAGGDATGHRMVTKPNLLRYDRVRGAERLHNAAKPVAMLADLMENSSDDGEIVLDLFGGSGSTLIAAEKSGRAARLMEIDPRWCDTIIERWQEFTGEKAIHDRTGEAFAR